MSILNIEFKAKTNKLTEQENLFLKQRPLFIGEDHQVDTYFNVAVGRLKLREGKILQVPNQAMFCCINISRIKH